MNANDDRAPDVAVAVEAGLRQCRARLLRVMSTRPDTDAGRAARAQELAQLCECHAGLWRELIDWLTTRPEVGGVFSLAAIEAEAAQHADARFWSDSAADWRRRADGEPVCGVIGCGCGGACGVPA